MAGKEVVWTAKALEDKIAILEYWIVRTRSKSYSIKLEKRIAEAESTIAQYPESGKYTDYNIIRIRIVSHYLIFYRIETTQIQIVPLWDAR